MYPKTCAGLLTAAVLLAIGCSQSPVAPSQTPTSMPEGATTLSAMSSRDLPFSGEVTGDAVFDFANPKGCILGFTTITTAKGQATHMGLTSWQSEHCLGTQNQIVDAELVLTAANGDQIHATYTGSCVGSGVIGELVICSGNAVFSGGTGRFENAHGTAAWRGAIVFEGFDDFSWPGRWEWKGRITY